MICIGLWDPAIVRNPKSMVRCSITIYIYIYIYIYAYIYIYVCIYKGTPKEQYQEVLLGFGVQYNYIKKLFGILPRSTQALYG